MVTGAEDLPTALALLRVARRWTQEDLAKASGVRASSLSDYERGKKIPALVTLRKILGGMGYPLAMIEEAQNFVYRVRVANKEIGVEPRAEEAEVLVSELGMGAPAEVRWEIEQVAAAGGRLVRRLLRLLLLLVARLWATRDAGPKDPPSEVAMEAIYAILAERFDSEDSDLAARHNASTAAASRSCRRQDSVSETQATSVLNTPCLYGIESLGSASSIANQKRRL